MLLKLGVVILLLCLLSFKANRADMMHSEVHLQRLRSDDVFIRCQKLWFCIMNSIRLSALHLVWELKDEALCINTKDITQSD